MRRVTDVGADDSTDSAARKGVPSFRAVVEQIAEGILVVAGDGTVTYANESATTLLGRSREHLRGDQFGVPSVTNDTTEICVAAEDGLRFLELKVRPLPAGDENSRLITLQDVTSYREDRDEAVEDFERLNRFLAVLSHEIRNPVGAVQSAFEIMSATKPADAGYRRAREIADKQLRQLRLLLDDLLDLSRVTQDKLELRCEPVELVGLMRDAVAASSASAKSTGHSLTSQTTERQLFVDGDRTRLTQVMSNLLSNAIRYTPRGSVIEVELTAENESAVLTVSDDGPGLSAELLNTVFEPFAQADDSLDRTDSGLGIGLALVDRIAGLHGGSIDVANRPEGGCRFTFMVPTIGPPPANPNGPAKDTRPTASTGDNGRRAVLAEDNPDLRVMLTMMLRNFGYTVTAVETGPAALEAIQSQSPDVAMLDIGLPGMTGFEVAEAVRSGTSAAKTPLLALTGYGSAEDRKQSLAAGFDEHMTKPPDFSVLRETLLRLSAS